MNLTYYTTMILVVIAASTASAEGGKTLASHMDVYVFPKSGQESSQQSQDEAVCYEWASENTGSNPFDLNKQLSAEANQTEQKEAAVNHSSKGSAVKGAVRGAAAGAVIGEITHNDIRDEFNNQDAKQGAKTGAVVGAVKGRRKARRAAKSKQSEAKQEQQGKAQQSATIEQIGNFKKAFSVCLEAKDYLVKY